MAPTSAPSRQIVVGVDGSESSLAALRWAAVQAACTDARLTVVHAWQLPEMGEWVGANPFELERDAFEEQAQAVVQRTIDQAGDLGDVEVDPATAMGPPARVLLRAAEDADLLVVGSRGRGGFMGLLLGSVSQHCVQHATCPVVVVPFDRPGEEERA